MIVPTPVPTTKPNTEPDADVIVAGAGPTGLMLAAELALAGVAVTVLDPLPGPDPAAPGVAINAGCAELLDQRGLLDTIRDDCPVLPGVHFSLLFLDLSEQRASHEDGYVVPQWMVTSQIEERATALGADIHRGRAVVGLAAGPDGVGVVARDSAGEHRLRARYLVGCDGRAGTVRGLAGIGFPGVEDPHCRGLIAEVEVDPARLAMEHFGAYVPAGGGSFTAAPVGPGLMRMTTVEYGLSVPPDTAATEAEFRASILRTTGIPLDCRKLRWVRAFTGATRVADRYRAGRVLLAGDAAHVFYPTNGFGLGTGIGDAVNLGWKLAAELAGRAPAGLLDTYQAERRPLAERLAMVTRAQGEILHPPERVEPIREVLGQLMRFGDVQRYLIDLLSGLDVRYPPAGEPDHPLLGARLPHVPLVTATGKATVAETLRAGRGVLLDLGAGAAELTDAAGWQRWVDVVAAEPVPEIPASAVLLRPDGHVAWLADATARGGSLRAALSSWFGAPGG